MSIGAELRAITKSFGAVQANREVNLRIRPGTIHALVGENGAGKSTAMKILYGMVRPDSGKILLDGQEVTQWDPQAAFRRGVGMVHQHFMLAGPETVHDNLVLGSELSRCGLRDRVRERQILVELMNATGLVVPLEKRVEELPIGLQSRCEILKVLYRKANLLILDEPTAVLTPQEVEDFLSTLRKLRAQGKTILIVTHKLREVTAVSDEVTVLRGGTTVATKKTADTRAEELSELMVGRRLQMPKVTRAPGQAERPVRVSLKMNKLSLKLHAGEITGIAGVEGNGQDELIAALTNPQLSPQLEELNILGHLAREFTSSGVRKLPVAVIPADRHKEGLVLDFTLVENLRLGRQQIRVPAWEYFGHAVATERKLLNQYDVRPGDPYIPARALSGGNQQKLVVARELGSLVGPSVILAVHPTRGVDLGAIEFIHGRVLEAAKAGAAVLLISSELDELMALSHRIGVLYRGSIGQWFEGPPYDESAIGLAMLTGGRP